MEIKHDNLMVRFNEGDRNAFEVIYNEFYDKLYYFVRRLTGDEEEGKDITLETFIKLWNLRHDFDTYDKVKAFLFITARNACFNFLRNAKIKIERAKQFTYTLKQWEDIEMRTSAQTELITELHELVEKELRKQVESLPEMARKVITMAFFEGKNTEQISIELNISRSTVRGHKKNGIDILQRRDALKNLIHTIWLILIAAAAISNFF